MKTIIAFAGSNSKRSINKQLASYTANLVSNVNVEILDLNDYQLPLYSVDFEQDNGLPNVAERFVEMIKKSDGIILSLAEHNGAYTAVFKNLFDWMSRVEQKTFQNKPMLLMATSPGARGGATVLEIAKGRFSYHNAQIVGEFSLPSFYENFSEGKINNDTLNEELLVQVRQFEEAL
ncbi:NADPH-dependent FMN reductase [Winogradskyella endarachnes]|uniref:NADPH-dependent FMN reductase n=1 Tax=Winogradskyella endarachnes TaxID=2681965 RepID=A0A6L6U8U6_9FLAO|nr:NAD(P)H-dependent oxidoreductase [Winogradskyella endarachnes]MUU77254.1 NADPH-dependent FMN reductase [Winogradskyella endarachnes]